METETKNTELLEVYGKNIYKPIEEEILLRPISKPLARFLSKTKIHPDHISFLGFFLTLFFSIFLFTGHVTNLYLGAFILYVINIFDKLDGDLARTKNIAGRKGQYIDGFLDALGEIILLSAWASVFAKDTNLALITLSVASPILFYYHSVSAPFYLDLEPSTYKKEPRNKAISFFYWNRAKFFLILIISLLIKNPQVVFWLFPFITIYTVLIYSKNIILGHTKR